MLTIEEKAKLMKEMLDLLNEIEAETKASIIKMPTALETLAAVSHK